MNIEISNLTAQPALAIQKKATTDNFVSLIDEAYAKIDGYLKSLGRKMSGAPYVAYLGFGGETEFEMEMGFPVSEALPVKDELFMSKTCAGKVVTAMHKGSYNELEKAYAEIMRYIEAHKLQPTGNYYDYYMNDPDVTPEDELLTKIVIPVQ